jgi:glycosyltransferase involved in cell wall biosynthesis
MREILERCYPEHAPGKVHVMPWGMPDLAYDDREIDTAAAALRQQLQIPPAAHVLLTLSRISPEKGQDQLLRALKKYQGRPLYVLICGGAAYMQGQMHLAKLKRLASELRNCTVLFPGHVTGIRKQAFFRISDLYVFPSRHESYGLTLLEALQAGLPAVCLDHSGARSVMREDFGILTKPDGLLKAITELLGDPNRRREMSEAARKFARTQPFSATAAQLAELLKSC